MQTLECHRVSDGWCERLEGRKKGGSLQIEGNEQSMGLWKQTSVVCAVEVTSAATEPVFRDVNVVACLLGFTYPEICSGESTSMEPDPERRDYTVPPTGDITERSSDRAGAKTRKTSEAGLTAGLRNQSGIPLRLPTVFESLGPHVRFAGGMNLPTLAVRIIKGSRGGPAKTSTTSSK